MFRRNPPMVATPLVMLGLVPSIQVFAAAKSADDRRESAKHPAFGAQTRGWSAFADHDGGENGGTDTNRIALGVSLGMTKEFGPGLAPS